MKPRTKFFAGLGLSCCSIYSHAQSQIIHDFSVSPKVCIVEPESTCMQKILVKWRLAKPALACLYVPPAPKPNYCSSEKRLRDEFEFQLKSKNSVQLALVVEQQMVKKEIRVLKLGKDVRRVKRHLWSIF